MPPGHIDASGRPGVPLTGPAGYLLAGNGVGRWP
jgi:hypothetical protein